VAGSISRSVVRLDLDDPAAQHRTVRHPAAQNAAEEIARNVERLAPVERRGKPMGASSTYHGYCSRMEAHIMKKSAMVALLVAAALGFILSPRGTAVAQEIQSVIVTNFPKVFNISGSVTVEGPVKMAKLAALREVVVPPVNPKDTVRLIQGGIVDSDGFTNMVLGLQGQIKGEVYRSGTVGVFLLPDEEPIVHAFEEKGLMQFATEVNAAGVSGASSYFASNSTRAPIGFPRYRTYFYNTSDKTVTANLFAYLTN
jgi:hypothetical protein